MVRGSAVFHGRRVWRVHGFQYPDERRAAERDRSHWLRPWPAYLAGSGLPPFSNRPAQGSTAIYYRALAIWFHGHHFPGARTTTTTDSDGTPLFLPLGPTKDFPSRTAGGRIPFRQHRPRSAISRRQYLPASYAGRTLLDPDACDRRVAVCSESRAHAPIQVSAGEIRSFVVRALGPTLTGTDTRDAGELWAGTTVEPTC